MASPFAASVLPLRKPEDEDPRLDPIEVDLSNPGDDVSFQDGAKLTELPGGAVEVDLNGGQGSKPKSDKFSANLALEIDDAELNRISTEIIEGIKRDDDSRQEHLEMIAEGMKLLGLVIESSNGSSASSSAPLEGMSTVRHPLLLEACQLFQASAMGELLPAAGPVKVRDDRPEIPEPKPMMGHNGGPPLSPFSPPPAPVAPPGANGASPQAAAPTPPSPGQPSPLPPGAGAPGTGSVPPSGPGMLPPPQPGMMPPPPVIPDEEEERDELAEALEKDFNHYLTTTDAGWVPDTDQMLFKVGFGGLGVKKVYNCPLKRMPLSRSVNIEDFIVSKDVSDLADAGRITHRIKMPRSTMRRMQIVGAYRDVPLGTPTIQSDQSNQVDQAKAGIAGVQPSSDPRDLDYEVFECYCELDLDEFAPKQFRGKGLPLPYKVVIEKESQKVLELRRNWREDDKECLAIQYFVDYPYMRAFGFYCIGLLHLLGNTTKALTALWREFIDAGMFANFPGFLYLKGAGRQLTNQFRVAPGSGVGLDASVTDIRQAVMPLPYKSPDAAFTAFVTHVEELGQRLGGTANQPTAEMKADAPVGTTLAIIEQASKPIGAVNKRLHQSQAREFGLLKERFRDDPEAFWRFNKRPAKAWEKAEFVKALNDYDMVPVSDPSNPTRMHRLAKAEAYKQMVAAAPQAFDQKKAILKYADEMGLSGVEDTLSPTIGQPQQPQIDPHKIAELQQKGQQAQMDAQTKAQDNQTDLQVKQMEMQNDAAERQNKLQLAQLSENTERLRLASTIAIHSDKMDEAQRGANIKLISDHASAAHGHMDALEQAQQSHQHSIEQGDLAHERSKETADIAHERSKELAKQQPKKDQ
ncbi:hypothetical protein IC762_12275 [Bradyrhizobium genosp. L]|uniref:hypothetical protein n=1 Tax=Bradyrhizobium genosp. L TaxID=83637 RepID=UPI0018A30F60|nr:hypothetical protein [Bradyrhizobium genosp. L]QPF87021.1 hypothetical protein IC762_12275 [Bradyrhizobium genosp. L]